MLDDQPFLIDSLGHKCHYELLRTPYERFSEDGNSGRQWKTSRFVRIIVRMNLCDRSRFHNVSFTMQSHDHNWSLPLTIWFDTILSLWISFILQYICLSRKVNYVNVELKEPLAYVSSVYKENRLNLKNKKSCPFLFPAKYPLEWLDLLTLFLIPHIVLTYM